MSGPKLLFVCAGNICRSPMAEGMARACVAREFPELAADVEIGSAGTIALDGNPPTPEAVEAMLRRGVDITRHAARRLTGELLAGYDLALAAECRLERYARNLLPAGEPPVFLLGALGGAADALQGQTSSSQAYPARLRALADAAAAVEADGDIQALAALETDDPIGMPLAEYVRVADTMQGPVESVLRFLLG